MLKLKLQYFGHLMWRTDSLEKTLMVGKTERRNRREQQDDTVGWHHRLTDMCLSKVWELVMNREAWHAAVHGVTKSRTWLGDWTEVLHKKWKHYNTFVPITLGWAEFRLLQKFLDQVYLVVPLRHVKYKIEALFSFFSSCSPSLKIYQKEIALHSIFQPLGTHLLHLKIFIVESYLNQKSEKLKITAKWKFDFSRQKC